MEKRDLDLKTKRFKTAQRREHENETEKKLRQESDRLKIAKKRQLIADVNPAADLNLETKRLIAAERTAADDLNLETKRLKAAERTAADDLNLETKRLKAAERRAAVVVIVLIF